MRGCVQPTHVQLINTYKGISFKKNNCLNNFFDSPNFLSHFKTGYIKFSVSFNFLSCLETYFFSFFNELGRQYYSLIVHIMSDVLNNA